ncbi:MAG: ABC transporter permease [Solirubrobacterales bacterium]|nr:ABC transporter permease [Solirubrobacterales bacterium]
MAPTRDGGVVTEVTPPKTPTGPARRLARSLRGRERWAPSSKLTYRIIGFASVIGLLVLWQIAADNNLVNHATSSSPSEVWNQARQMVSDGTLGSAVAASGKLYGVGLGVSVLIGVFGGIILGWWRLLGAIFDPWIAMLYSTPLIAVLPLILVWFGINFKGQVVMVVVVSVFPLLVNVMAGVRQVEPRLLRLARSFRGSQLAILRTLVLPSIVPYIVTGLRLAAGAGLIGVTVAEYFEGENGVGGVILRAGTELNTSEVFVGVAVLAGAALTMTLLIRMVEARVSGWRDDD